MNSLPSAHAPILPHGFRLLTHASAQRALHRVWDAGVAAGRTEGVVVGAIGGGALTLLIAWLIHLYVRRGK